MLPQRELAKIILREASKKMAVLKKLNNRKDNKIEFEQYFHSISQNIAKV